MIESAPAQRGMVGNQHGLTKLTETLEALTQGQTAQQQRDDQIKEQFDQIREHLTTHTARVNDVVDWLRYQLYGLVALAVLVLTWGGAVGWQLTHKPDMAYARALGALDQAVVQQWSTMPKGTQEALTSVYTRIGLQPPSQRK
jgi:hypothetical protein